MGDANRASKELALVALAGFLVLAMFALSVPIDHDEGQYIAATRLVAEGWRPILDFPYLQTPLQPVLLAPLQWAFAGQLLIASRLANALFVAGAAWITGRTAQRLSGRRDIGWLAALLLLLCDSVQFGGSVARNDALPLFLFALGLERLLAVKAPGARRLLAGGLALGLAASTKVSYALPAAGAAIVFLIQLRSRNAESVAALIAGLLLGGLPTLCVLAADPHRAWFYMVTYSVDAVRAFQTLNGSLDQLGWARRLVRFVKFAAMGPLLLLLGVCLRDLFRRNSQTSSLLRAIFGFALLATILPMPMYRQYLVPLVVPAILLAVASGGLGWALGRRRTAVIGGLAVLAALGTFRSAKEALSANEGERPLSVEVDAHRIGALVRANGGATITSLDAVRASDSGLSLDRRLAPGPFLFRAGNLPACVDRSLCPLTFASVDRLEVPLPDAIVTGTESRPIGAFQHGLDGTLVEWSRSKGYRPHPVGQSVLWLKPSPQRLH